MQRARPEADIDTSVEGRGELEPPPLHKKAKYDTEGCGRDSVEGTRRGRPERACSERVGTSETMEYGGAMLDVLRETSSCAEQREGGKGREEEEVEKVKVKEEEEEEEVEVKVKEEKVEVKEEVDKVEVKEEEVKEEVKEVVGVRGTELQFACTERGKSANSKSCQLEEEHMAKVPR